MKKIPENFPNLLDKIMTRDVLLQYTFIYKGVLASLLPLYSVNQMAKARRFVFPRRVLEVFGLADMVTYQAAAGGSGVYRNNKVGFVASYYKKKEMDDLYPAGGFNVCGQLGKGRDEIGVCVAADAHETVYAVSKMPHAVVKGYVRVGENDYLAVVKDVLALWLFLIVLALLLLAGLGLLIHNVVAASGTPEPETKAPGVVDSNAVYGEGQISVPEKTDTRGRQIKVNGIAEMNLKAGVREQNFVFSNPEENPCYFQIEVVLSDSGEVIYTSNLLPPGYSISNFSLNRALDAGSYRAVVHVKTYSFDKEQRQLNNMDIKTTIVASE